MADMAGTHSLEVQKMDRIATRFVLRDDFLEILVAAHKLFFEKNGSKTLNPPRFGSLGCSLDSSTLGLQEYRYRKTVLCLSGKRHYDEVAVSTSEYAQCSGSRDRGHRTPGFESMCDQQSSSVVTYLE